MRVIASISGYLGLIMANAVFASLVLVFGLLESRGRLWWPMGRLWGRTILTGSLSRLQASGFEQLEWNQPAILMANHQSYMDVPSIIAACPVPLRFVARKEVFKAPIMGAAMRATGQICVDRSNRERAIASLRAAASTIAEGRTVLLFPEGTRSFDGELQAFKKGGFMLALQAQVPIIPVGIDGTAAIAPRGDWLFCPGRVRVVMGDPIPTAGLSVEDRDALMERVRSGLLRAQTRAKVI